MQGRNIVGEVVEKEGEYGDQRRRQRRREGKLRVWKSCR